MKYFHWIAIGFVAVVVVGAFFLIGSPAHQRLVRLDNNRLSDLQDIQYQVSNYFAAKDQLPAALADMNGFKSYTVPVDPETGASYEYIVKDSLRFQLCANFALSNIETEDGQSVPARDAFYGKGITSASWQHPAGRGCFDMTIENPVFDSEYPIVPSVTVKPVV